MMALNSGLLLMTALLFPLLGYAQNEPRAFVLYNSKGEEVRFNDMIDDMHKADVVLVGELHNNPICHWMELKIAEKLFEKDSTLDIGMEMFESDDQTILDEYLSGAFKEFYFKGAAKLWKNYKTDYKPIVEFAKKHPDKIRFFATNVPRRYAGVVSAKGFEGLGELSDEAKSYIAPLPIRFDTTAPNYAEMMQMQMGHGSMSNIVKAQALKDATMAHFILKNKRNGVPFVHYQGDFHSKNKGGINVYLKWGDPEIKAITLSPVESDSMKFDESYRSLGDYILVIPKDMTKTY